MMLPKSATAHWSIVLRMLSIDLPRNPVPTSTILRVAVVLLEDAADAAAEDARRRESIMSDDQLIVFLPDGHWFDLLRTLKLFCCLFGEDSVSRMQMQEQYTSKRTDPSSHPILVQDHCAGCLNISLPTSMTSTFMARYHSDTLTATGSRCFITLADRQCSREVSSRHLATNQG